MARKARSMANTTKNALVKAGRYVNAADKALNGALSQNTYGRAAMKASNMAVRGLTAFDSLMSTFGPQGIDHPGITNGSVAGVSNQLRVRQSKPKLTSGQGVVRITHKELIGDVTNVAGLQTSLFFSTSGASIFQVNPQCGSTFNWLSTIANCYDMYRFRRARLVYVPLCSTATAGRILLGYDPDSTDSVPQDRQSLANTHCATEGSVWGTQYLDLELSDTNKWYYANQVDVNNGGDAYLDQGQVFWAVWSGAAGGAIGEVYIMYDIELKNPQAPSGGISAANGIAAVTTTQFPSNVPYQVRSTATAIEFTFYTTGQYAVYGTAASTASGGPSTTGGITRLGDQTANNGTRTVFFAHVSVTGGGSLLTYTGLTGLAGYAVYVTRLAGTLPFYT